LPTYLIFTLNFGFSKLDKFCETAKKKSKFNISIKNRNKLIFGKEMEIQEIFYEMLTPAQRLRIQKAKAIAAKFVEFKAYCEQNDVAVNTEGFCRAMGKEYKYSTLAIRRMLEREGVLVTTKIDDKWQK
jgi:hypothetical protein